MFGQTGVTRRDPLPSSVRCRLIPRLTSPPQSPIHPPPHLGVIDPALLTGLDPVHAPLSWFKLIIPNIPVLDCFYW